MDGIEYWFNQYDLWKDEAKEEAAEKLRLTSEELEDVEICENGQINLGQSVITRPNFVTAWKDSIHFIE